MNNRCVMVLSLAVSFMLGAGLMHRLDLRGERRQAEEVQLLTAELLEARESETKIIAQRDRWQGEAERLRRQGDEVHKLRAEVSLLTSEMAQLRRSRETRSLEDKKTELLAEASKKSVKILKEVETGSGLIPLENAPPAVAATVLREIANAPVAGLFTRNRDGQTTYGLKAQLADGRGIALTIRDDGTLLEKSAELPRESLPPHIQSTFAQTFGDLGIGGVRQIVDESSVRYELSAKGPQSTMEMTVREDGTVLAYAARLRSGKEGEKRR